MPSNERKVSFIHTVWFWFQLKYWKTLRRKFISLSSGQKKFKVNMWGLQWLFKQGYKSISLPGSIKVKKTRRKSFPLTHFITHFIIIINYWEMHQLIVYLLKLSYLDFWTNREMDGHSSIFITFFPHVRECYIFPWAVTNGPICYGICSQLGQSVLCLHYQKFVCLKAGESICIVILL